LNIIKNELNKNSNVHEVFYQKDLVDKLNKNINRLSVFLLTFCGLLFIIAFALINNTIRLSVYAKRFLIRTMRLVGATNNFIQKPFLIKGLYQGVYSSIFAIFMLIGSIQLVQGEAANILNITDLKIIGLVFIIIFFSGLFISWISTYFAVRKFIKQNESELYN
jgi:cell division transport system permease protein